MITEYISSGDLKMLLWEEKKLMTLCLSIDIYGLLIIYSLMSHLILMIILTFFPLVIYNIFKETLNEKWAKYFLIFWFIIPLFEAFGFFIFIM